METNEKTRFGIELGKFLLGVTLLTVLIVLNQHTYKLVQCMTRQMEALTMTEVGRECSNMNMEPWRFQLCQVNDTHNMLSAYRGGLRVCTWRSPAVETLGTWLRDSTLRPRARRNSLDANCPWYSEYYDVCELRMCFDSSTRLLGLKINNYTLSGDNTRSLVSFLR